MDIHVIRTSIEVYYNNRTHQTILILANKNYSTRNGYLQNCSVGHIDLQKLQVIESIFTIFFI